MVERLRQSVEHLEPPSCATCHLSMRWYRSTLMSAAVPPSVSHFFQCPNCHRVRETKTPVQPGDQAVDPKKLSKPQNHFSCAA